MIRDILSAAGVEYAQGRFIRIPTGTHAVYFDDVEVETADPVALQTGELMPRIYHHTVTVEVYEPTPDDVTESAIEAELNARGLPWTKQDRYWLKDLQRYQTIYEITYHTKRRT
jgi:hypothetical protein